MLPNIYKKYFPFFLALLLIGCNQQSRDSPITTQSKTSNEQITVANNPDRDSAETINSNTSDGEGDRSAIAHKPGTYCYTLSNEIEDIQVRLTINNANTVTGNVEGIIHDEKNSYYSSYRQKVNGNVKGNNLDVNLVTWIEYDEQTSQESWQFSPAALITDKQQLSTANCAQVNQAFQNENGLEAQDLIANANQVRTEEVFFDTGTSSTTVSNSVVSGDRDVYILGAQGGQQMDLAITSLERNAVFDVVDPSGIILGTELTKETLLLPHTGKYQIIVGGTRGNASYDLAISIE